MDIVRKSDPAGRRRRLAVQLAFVLVLVAVAGVALSRQKPAVPSLGRSQAWIDTVRRGTLRIQIHGSGVLAPENVQWIAAAADGRVERVLVLPGAPVRDDSVLLDIQNPELQQAAVDAELQLRAAEAECNNRRNQVESALLTQEALDAAARADAEEARLRATADDELAKAGLISALTLKFSRGREAQLATRVAVEDKRLRLARESRETEVAAAAARVEQLRALVALRHQQRDGLHVRAGRAGIVQEVAVEPGQRVNAGAVLARVAAPFPLKAVIQVSEVQASQLAAGQAVDVDVHTGIVRGTVARIDPSVHNGSVTVDVALPRELPSGARPDLSVDATIDVATIANAVFVGRPVQADAKGTLMLFRLAPDGTTAVRTSVRTGRMSFNAIEVLGGLAPGDRVILSDTSAFDRFDRIAITDQEARP
ncbi:MAG: HlyD family efflux transporter periplasmic adaptor subunit [Acidobacteria bacterium]|nr:HlyD family efflux transporter periplasmic adaptor subunit [Acidobacteriota bacterium]MBV9475116.1 HlyD family efflux transporter periplasmic adaptor subunit [Acidobacteriota bacterium]